MVVGRGGGERGEVSCGEWDGGLVGAGRILLITSTVTHANAHTSTQPNPFPRPTYLLALSPVSAPPHFSTLCPHICPHLPSPLLPFPCRPPFAVQVWEAPTYRSRTAHCGSARQPTVHPPRWPLHYRPAPPPLVVIVSPGSARNPAPAARLESIPQIARFAKACQPGSRQV